MEEQAIWVINGLTVILIGVVGTYVKSIVLELKEIDERHSRQYEKLESIQDTQYEKLRDRIDSNQKEIYQHWDKEAEKLRRDINNMGDKLRDEIAALNKLIMRLITKSENV